MPVSKMYHRTISWMLHSKYGGYCHISKARHFLEDHKFLGSFAKLWKLTIGFVMCVCLSVRPFEWNNSAPTGRIFMKFDIWRVFQNSVEKIQVSLKSDNNNGHPILLYIFFILLRSFLLRMRNVSHKSRREKYHDTHFVFTNFLFFFPRKSCRLFIYPPPQKHLLVLFIIAI